MNDLGGLSDLEFEELRPELHHEAELDFYGSEAVAWSPLRRLPVHLEQLPALVAQFLDGDTPVSDIVDDVHEVVGVPRGIARTQMRRIVSLLEDRGLLDSSSPETTDLGIDEDLFIAPPNP